MASQVVLRFAGELGTKARFTRREFERRLLRNLKDALRSEGVEAALKRTRDRIFVIAEDRRAEDALSRLFGIQSLARVERIPFTSLEALVAAAEPLFRDAVAQRRFAVRARRIGNAPVGFRSRDLEVQLGAALLPHAAGVDLSHPEVTAHVELHEGEAHCFREQISGPGGLPLGVEGSAIALVSGGFDSAVAVWQMQRRGVALDYLFCNLGGASHRLGAARVMKVIADRWSYGTRPHLHALDFTGVARELRERCEPRYWQVLLKRLMLRAAERIAAERDLPALVTGESVGQVSSQTLQNLAVISQATPLPILRPLVGFNKDEIIALAGRIGTRELSAVVGEYCDLAAPRPATAAALDAVIEQESRLDLSGLEKAVVDRSVFDLRRLDVDELGVPGAEIDSIPDDASVIDLRSKAAYAGWHWPGALHLDFGDALAAHESVARDRVYVLYCEFGLKSSHLAELMREKGLEAYNFRGGLRGLVRYARSAGVPGPD